ncbi:MAG: NAD(P)/FAD-dependent oxidoreductase [Bacteroidota bacterium]
MQKTIIKPNYDVIIIGSGISGLTSAALLSKAGLSICVLEMESKPGGYLAGYSRKNFRFETAIHWLNQCGPEGIVSKVFNLIGSDYPKAKSQTRIRRLTGDKFDYLLTNNPDELKNKLIADFPHEKKGIQKFFNSAKKIGKSLDNFNKLFRSQKTMSFLEKVHHKLKILHFALPFIPYVRYTGDKGVTKGLNRFFKDKGLHQIFCSEPDLLSCLIPIAWAYFGDYQIPPTGGSKIFPEWLSYVVNYYNNSIFFKCKVTKILLEENKCKGVTFEHQGIEHEVNSSYVIAACDVETLYEKMLPADTISSKLQNKLKNAILYSSAVTVSLGLDCPSEDLGFDEELIYLSRNDLQKKEQVSGNPEKSRIIILASSIRDESLAPKNHGTLTIFIPAFIDYNNYWLTGKDENGNFIRGEEYKKLKSECAEIMIDRVEEKIAPGLKDHILFYDVATPITYWRYTGNKNGSMMGAKPCRENFQAKIAHYQTPVSNLLLSGHWADLGGGVPIAVKSAVNTTLLILKNKNKKAFKLLANYIDGKARPDEINSSSCFKPYDNSWVQELTSDQKDAMYTRS